MGGTLGAPDINTTLPRTRKSHSYMTADTTYFSTYSLCRSTSMYPVCVDTRSGRVAPFDCAQRLLMASRFRAIDFAILGVPALGCFALWISQRDAEHLAPLREQKAKAAEASSPATGTCAAAAVRTRTACDANASHRSFRCARCESREQPELRPNPLEAQTEGPQSASEGCSAPVVVAVGRRWSDLAG